LREDRVVVSETPGTTRDAVDTYLTISGQPVVLIDTAGLRHRRKVTNPVDTFSMMRTAEAIDRCHVALVVLDGTQGVTRDDQRIVQRVLESGCGLVVLVNKWDLVVHAPGRGGPRTPREAETQLTAVVARAMPSAAFAPVVAVSAKTGFRVSVALTTALGVACVMREGVAEAELLALLKTAWAAHAPPRYLGRAIRLRAARWSPGRPNRIILTVAPLGHLPGPYEHYVLKRLHTHPRLHGVPVSLVVQTAERR
jgi:GTP-binding protein